MDEQHYSQTPAPTRHHRIPMPASKTRKRTMAVSDDGSGMADRILEASLRLFNEQGLQNVPVLKIAMSLGISSGHVAYHYKTKRDIVLAVFAQLEQAVNKDFAAAKRPEQPFLPLDAALQQIEVFRSLWRYRFFFNALTHLLTGDEQLRERYARMQDNIVGGLRTLLDELIAQNSMLPVPPPNSTQMLAKNCWMIWLSWLRFEQIEHPDRDAVRNASVLDGVMQTFSIIQPYFSTEFESDMLRELRIALSD